MRRLERLAAGLSFAAALVHGSAGPEHFAEWWGYGIFFYAAAAAQAVYGIVLATQGIEAWGGWTAIRSKVYLAGIAGNLAIIALWLVTRLIGVPAGPEAGETEPFGVLDAVSKVIEVALIVVLFWLFTLVRAETPISPTAPSS